MTDTSTLDPMMAVVDVRPSALSRLNEQPIEKWKDSRGYTLSDRIWVQGRDQRRKIDTVLRQGIAKGHTLDQVSANLQKHIKPTYAGDPAYAGRRLANYEMRRAYALGTQDVAKTNPAGGSLLYKTSAGHAHPDECTTIAARQTKYGTGVYSAANCPLPPRHVGCFPAGTMVSARGVRQAMVRWWDGDLCHIVTAGGHFLAVTPNHPILTPDGWIAAGDLQEGGQVVRYGGREGVQIGAEPYHNGIPSPIQDVLETLRGLGFSDTVSVPTTPEDFHGDGVPDGQVNVVTAHRPLGNGHNTALRQPPLQDFLRWGNVGAVALSGGGHLASLGFGVGALGSGVRGLRERAAVILRHIRETVFRGGGPSPDVDPVRLQELDNRFPGYSQLASQLLGGGSGLVAFDQITGIARVPFSGHVYNLSTDEGWYSSNGFIVHNCNCYVVEVGVRQDEMVHFAKDLRSAYGLDLEPTNLSPSDLQQFRLERDKIKAQVQLQMNGWLEQTGLFSLSDTTYYPNTVAEWTANLKAKKAAKQQANQQAQAAKKQAALQKVKQHQIDGLTQQMLDLQSQLSAGQVSVDEYLAKLKPLKTDLKALGGDPPKGLPLTKKTAVKKAPQPITPKSANTLADIDNELAALNQQISDLTAMEQNGQISWVKYQNQVVPLKSKVDTLQNQKQNILHPGAPPKLKSGKIAPSTKAEADAMLAHVQDLQKQVGLDYQAGKINLGTYQQVNDALVDEWYEIFDMKPGLPDHIPAAVQKQTIHTQAPKPAPTTQPATKTGGKTLDQQRAQIKRDVDTMLTTREKNSLVSYTGSEYRAINQALREKKTLDLANAAERRLAHHVENIDGAMAKMALEQDTLLYRGMQSSKAKYANLKPGDVLPDEGYMSTSWDSGTWQRFGGTGHGSETSYWITFEAPAGTGMMPVESFSLYKSENEILLERGSMWDILEVEKNYNGLNITRIRARIIPGSQNTGRHNP